MSEREKSCRTCRFWHEGSRSCRACPPVRVGPEPQRRTPQGELLPAEGPWPETCPDDWCGEWRGLE